jgi:hypothetical protein
VEKEDLREQLAALHAALGDGESVGPEARELLRAVMEDIERVLDIEAGDERDEGLVDRLREAVGDFEESHPTLAEAAGRVIDALARMGI